VSFSTCSYHSVPAPTRKPCASCLQQWATRTCALNGRLHALRAYARVAWTCSVSSRPGSAAVLVIAQIKQYRRPVQRRFIDELRGAMLRTGARQGLVISTGTFSEAAEQVASSERLAPIRLVGGDELAALMIRYGIGVEANGGDEHRADHEFFEDLRERYPVHGRRGSASVGAVPDSKTRAYNHDSYNPTHIQQERR